jgi:hypothetical protein
VTAVVGEPLDEEAGRRTVDVTGVAGRAQLQMDGPPVFVVLRRHRAHDQAASAA